MTPLPPTARQLQAFREYVAAGRAGQRLAAARLGIAEGTLRQHLAEVRGRLGAETNEQAAVILAARGDLSTEYAG